MEEGKNERKIESESKNGVEGLRRDRGRKITDKKHKKNKRVYGVMGGK